MMVNTVNTQHMGLLNRIGATGETMKSNVKTGVAAGTVGAAGGALVGYVATHEDGKVAKTIAKFVDKAIASKPGKVLVDAAKKGLTHVKAHPTVAKAAAAIAIPLAIVGNLISYKQAYNTGKIQQKYEDLDKFSRHMEK